MCGIFGVFNVAKPSVAADVLALGLYGLQHRGGDGVGIVTTDGIRFFAEGGHGTVYSVLPDGVRSHLFGNHGVGHVRYATTAKRKGVRQNLGTLQPILGRYGNQAIAIAHNGNITNGAELDRLLKSVTFTTSMDTEYVLRLLELYATGDIEKDIAYVFSLLEGSITLGVLLPDKLIAIRDKSGCRPLTIGKIGNGYCITSEDCVFPGVRATHVMDVDPGKMVVIDDNGFGVKKFAEPKQKKCMFEHVYFSKAESVVFGQSVSETRMHIGRMLARVCDIRKPHLVVPVPLSSIPIALGYAEESAFGRYYQILSRNLDRTGSERSFTAPTQEERLLKVARKFNVNKSQVDGKVILVIDDSIVRGTTMPGIVAMLRWCGAIEVHVAVGSPPFKHQCFYGIYTPTEEELLAASRSIEEIRMYTDADTLTFLSLDDLKQAVPDPENYCTACVEDDMYW